MLIHLLNILASLFGVCMDTQMWNMVMPVVFHLPKLTYLDMFLGCLALRYILSQEYTTEILWSKHLKELDKNEQLSVKISRLVMFFTGQVIMFFIIMGIMYVYESL